MTSGLSRWWQFTGVGFWALQAVAAHWDDLWALQVVAAHWDDLWALQVVAAH